MSLPVQPPRSSEFAAAKDGRPCNPVAVRNACPWYQDECKQSGSVTTTRILHSSDANTKDRQTAVKKPDRPPVSSVMSATAPTLTRDTDSLC